MLHGESVAILRALGTKYGYYPKNPMEQLKVDEIVDVYSGALPKLYGAAF